MMIISLIVLISYLFEHFKKSKRNVNNDEPRQATEPLLHQKKKNHFPLEVEYVEENSVKLFSCCQDTESIFHQKEQNNFPGEAEFVKEHSVQFFPPVYLQRYKAVCTIIEKNTENINTIKVVDFGCSNLAFFNFVKRVNGVEEYLAVDIDKETVENYFTRVFPLTSDYLHKRDSPLKAVVLLGSVTEPDVRLKNTNVVVAIELIEHMYPNELNELPFNIFGFIQPEIAIFTTPNADFNVLFKKLVGFRHPDHKFEWSRLQFEDWGQNLVTQYPDYDVTFYGIGRGPKGTEELGCCSQMAVFLRKTIKSPIHFEDLVLYKSVYEIDYPFETAEEKLKNLLDYEVYRAINDLIETRDYTNDSRIEIPLQSILEKLSFTCSFETLLAYLEKLNKNVEYINEKATLIEPHDTDGSSCLSSVNNDVESVGDAICEYIEEEFWDNPVINAGNMESNQPTVDDLNQVEAVKSSTVRSDTGNLAVDWNHLDDMDPWESTSSTLLRSSLDDSGATGSSSKEVKALLNVTNENVVNTSSCRNTGAIPKRREIPQETCLSSASAETLFSKNASCKSLDPLKVSQSSLYSLANITNQLSADGGILKFSTDVDGSCTIDTLEANKSNVSLYNDSFCVTFNDITSTPYQHRPQHSFNKCQRYSENSKTGIEYLSIGKTPQNNVGMVRSSCKSCGNCSHEISEEASSSYVHRCHSLENVNINNSKNKSFRYSLNIDNELDCDTSVVDMELEVCCKGSGVASPTDTLGSHSKAPDSGYPNSSHEMEMDLTPEQVDEIITETESSLEDEDSSADDIIEQVQGNAPVMFLDNVENGDVANNNRDGEGNNMEGREVPEEVLDFEGLVLGAADVEAAGQHESDDEGLYLSALDISNETLIPEDSSSHDGTVFNSMLDLPSSSSSFFSAFISPPEEYIEFPSWLLDLSINLTVNLNIGSGDGGLDVSEVSSSELVVAEDEVIVPGDTMGGGDPTRNN